MLSLLLSPVVIAILTIDIVCGRIFGMCKISCVHYTDVYSVTD
jgi:hypothetical protein